MGKGVAIIKEEDQPQPKPRGILDWLKANWPWVASGGLGVGLIITLAKRRK